METRKPATHVATILRAFGLLHLATVDGSVTMATAADTRMVSIRLSHLTEHLGCVICHGLLRDAQTIPECLHSFCKSCIYRHFLVQGSRVCPKCHLTLKPRPITTLISDQKLQDVVDRIFPEFKQSDERLETEFYELHGFQRKEPTDQTLAARPPTTINGRRVKPLAPLVSGGPRRAVVFTIEVLPIQNGKTTDVKPLAELHRPFLHVESRFKMFDLLKWLRRQLHLNEKAEIEILCMGAIVGPELSVSFIHRTMWQLQHDDSERLVLHYRLLIP